MNTMEEALTQTVTSIWESLLGTEIHAAAYSAGMESDGALVGCIHVTGPAGGVVTLRCSHILARQAAAAMFQKAPADVQLSEEQDALAELTNIVGGNFKALLSDGHHLSLPIVVEGADFRTRFVGTELAAHVAFDCGGVSLVASFFHSSPARPS